MQKLRVARVRHGIFLQHQRSLVQNLNQQIPKPQLAVGKLRLSAVGQMPCEDFQMIRGFHVLKQVVHRRRHPFAIGIADFGSKAKQRLHCVRTAFVDFSKLFQIAFRHRLRKAAGMLRPFLPPLFPFLSPYKNIVFKLGNFVCVKRRKARFQIGKNRVGRKPGLYDFKCGKHKAHERFGVDCLRPVHKIRNFPAFKGSVQNAAVAVGRTGDHGKIAVAVILFHHQPADGCGNKGGFIIRIVRLIQHDVVVFAVRCFADAAVSTRFHCRQRPALKPRSAVQNHRRHNFHIVLFRKPHQISSRAANQRKKAHAVLRVVELIGTECDVQIVCLRQNQIDDIVFLHRKALEGIERHGIFRKKMVAL